MLAGLAGSPFRFYLVIQSRLTRAPDLGEQSKVKGSV